MRSGNQRRIVEHQVRAVSDRRTARTKALWKVGNEIDDLRNDFDALVDLLTKSLSKHTEFVEAVVAAFSVLEKAGAAFGIANLPKITKIVISHDAQLKTLEASMMAGKSKGGRKRKRNS